MKWNNWFKEVRLILIGATVTAFVCAFWAFFFTSDANLAKMALALAISFLIVGILLYLLTESAKKRIFIICPVRNVDEETKKKIAAYVERLENHGYKIHWPSRDTNQDDPVGLAICSQNREAIYDAHEVHIWFDMKSQGSLFDVGMLFMAMRNMKKHVVLINRMQVDPTPHKSFQNVILSLT